MERSVVLEFGSESFTFGWVETTPAQDFGRLLQDAVRGATGLTSLTGVELHAARGRDNTMELVQPRDLFEGRVQGKVLIVVPKGTAASRATARMAPAAVAPAPRRTNGNGYSFAKKGGSMLNWVRKMGSIARNGDRHRRVPVSEVQQHSSAQDAWTVIDGKVYNITPFLDFHPGGADELMRGAGTDCSALFREIHSWISVDMIEQLQVGVVDQCLRPVMEDEEDEESSDSNDTQLEPALHPSEWRAFPLARSERRGSNALMLRFDLGADRPLGLQPGQHLKVRMHQLHGQQRIEIQREYTPVSDPDALGFVELLVKVYPSGRMGPALASLKPSSEKGDKAGDHLELQGPFGDLTYLFQRQFRFGGRQLVASHVVMVAAGSGITPMSQLLTVMHREPQERHPRATLVFCNRHEEDIMLRQGLEDMAKRESKWFRLCFVLSEPPSDSPTWQPPPRLGDHVKHVNGRISNQVVSDALGDEAADVPPGKDDPPPLVLICGPDGFNRAVVDILQTLGVPRSQVHVF